MTRRLLLLLAAAPVLAFAARMAAAEDDPTRRPVASGRDLHIACGQAVEGFDDRIYEPVARAIMLVQCHAIVNAVAETIRRGAYTLDGAPVWTCVDIPDEAGALADDFVSWIGRNPRAGRESAVLAFVRAIEETYPCAE